MCDAQRTRKTKVRGRLDLTEINKNPNTWTDPQDLRKVFLAVGGDLGLPWSPVWGSILGNNILWSSTLLQEGKEAEGAPGSKPKSRLSAVGLGPNVGLSQVTIWGSWEIGAERVRGCNGFCAYFASAYHLFFSTY